MDLIDDATLFSIHWLNADHLLTLEFVFILCIDVILYFCLCRSLRVVFLFLPFEVRAAAIRQSFLHWD